VPLPPGYINAIPKEFQDPVTHGLSFKKFIGASEKQQDAFHATRNYRFVLYGGAMGGGKSYFLRMWAITECYRLYAAYGIRGVRIGLFSKDYPTLVDRQISKISFEIPTWIGKISNSQVDGFRFLLNPEFGSGVVALRNLDKPEKYNSAEFAGIAVEELTENPEIIFHELRKRIRWPGIDPNDMHFVAAANPGGLGHAWVKKLWIDRDFPTELATDAHEFAYVSAKALDNPHLDPGYYKQLMTLPDEMRKAYAEGSWDIFAGQYFKTWRKDIHVCDEAFEIPYHWKIERSSDWGEAAPCAHIWTATSPEGFSYVIGEVYGKGLSIPEQATAIKAFERGKNVQKYGILDSACWDVTGRALSIADQFAVEGVYMIPGAKGPGSRVAGWNMVRQALAYKQVDGKLVVPPKLQLFPNCTNGIRIIPAQVHDKLKPEDLDTDAEDHWLDALRYKFQGPQMGFTIPDEALSSDAAARRRQAGLDFNNGS
jgi:phage terminase large subunit